MVNIVGAVSNGIDAVTDGLDKADELATKGVGEGVQTGPPPLLEGIGGPVKGGAKAGAGILSRLSGGSKAAKAATAGSAAAKASKTAKAVTSGSKAKNIVTASDIARRAASLGTLGENPVNTAKDAADSVSDFEVPEVDIPELPGGPNDEPDREAAGPPLGLLAVGAVVVGGVVFIGGAS